jgi:antirestriction protein ArdC
VPNAVYMPGFDQFPDAIDYYSTLACETTHWTSHTSRCDRQLGKRFGDSLMRWKCSSPSLAVPTRWRDLNSN